MQNELTQAAPLLDYDGTLTQIGWSRQPILDANLENVSFYPKAFQAFQFIRLKRWDYYAIFSPQRFFSATIADLGYAGNIFVYTLDYDSKILHEEGIVIPLARGVTISTQTTGVCEYNGKGIHLKFLASQDSHRIFVDWPGFHDGRGIQADLNLEKSKSHESMNITIPIPGKRFYYNHKINCLPASGSLNYGGTQEVLEPNTALGQLDWGRGVWKYSSFWNWASASGFLPDGRTIGLNLGCGFGDTSAATENALILAGKVHKLDQIEFNYDPGNYMDTWKFRDNLNRINLNFTPFKERLAATRLAIIDSEVHQMFGHFTGHVTADDGEEISIHGLVGFAEEHRARW